MVERCKILGGDDYDRSDIIEIKKLATCETCGYEGMVWFIENDEQVSLCDECLKASYLNCEIIPIKKYEGKIYPNCGMALKIVKRGIGFEVLYKPLTRDGTLPHCDWLRIGVRVGNVPAMFQSLNTAKEFIKFLNLSRPDFDEIQSWIMNHN